MRRGGVAVHMLREHAAALQCVRNPRVGLGGALRTLLAGRVVTIEACHVPAAAVRRGRVAVRTKINQQRQERPRYLSTDEPDTRSRSLLSRSRVNRAVEAARRIDR